MPGKEIVLRGGSPSARYSQGVNGPEFTPPLFSTRSRQACACSGVVSSAVTRVLRFVAHASQRWWLHREWLRGPGHFFRHVGFRHRTLFYAEYGLSRDTIQDEHQAGFSFLREGRNFSPIFDDID